LCKPLVSIITPAYNREKYIEKTIYSVINQPYDNIEYFVIDDGSTDKTYSLLKEFDNCKYIKLLSHKNHINCGQSASINLGLTMVNGKYVTILDSDDMFHPEKLSKQVEFLEKHSNIGMVYGQIIAIDKFDKELFQYLSENHNETSDPNILLLNCYIPSPGACLVRKSIFEKVGFFEENFRSSQDHDMALRIFEKTDIAYLPDVSLYYRIHEDSISTKCLETRWRTGFEILRRAKNRYPYKGSTIRKRTAVLNFRMAQVFYKQKRYFSAFVCLVKSGILDPLRAKGVLMGDEKIN
jgi:glycosyltransferase involved in cell wall biosynthesis